MAPTDPEKCYDLGGEEKLWCAMRERADRHMATTERTDTQLSFYTNNIRKKLLAPSWL
jgi:hypothetical protein